MDQWVVHLQDILVQVALPALEVLPQDNPVPVVRLDLVVQEDHHLVVHKVALEVQGGLHLAVLAQEVFLQEVQEAQAVLGDLLLAVHQEAPVLEVLLPVVHLQAPDLLAQEDPLPVVLLAVQLDLLVHQVVHNLVSQEPQGLQAQELSKVNHGLLVLALNNSQDQELHHNKLSSLGQVLHQQANNQDQEHQVLSSQGQALHYLRVNPDLELLRLVNNQDLELLDSNQ